MTVRASAPGGTRTTTRRLRLRVARRPRAPAAARRSASSHAAAATRSSIRWHTAEPTRRQQFLVAGYVRRRDVDNGLPDAFAAVLETGRRRFSVRVEDTNIRWVTVVAVSDDRDGSRPVEVPVR